jgi:TIR domain-containing protein
MKVFISWSGTASQKLARQLKDWLPTVIQAVEPFMSEVDIEKGARWSDKLAAELESGQYGIVCLTPDNKDAAWLHYEAGAISKTIKDARVAPLLFDLAPSDIRGPLSSFQCTSYQKDEVRKLLNSINSMSEKPLAEQTLTSIF